MLLYKGFHPFVRWCTGCSWNINYLLAFLSQLFFPVLSCRKEIRGDRRIMGVQKHHMSATTNYGHPNSYPNPK